MLKINTHKLISTKYRKRRLLRNRDVLAILKECWWEGKMNGKLTVMKNDPEKSIEDFINQLNERLK